MKTYEKIDLLIIDIYLNKEKIRKEMIETIPQLNRVELRYFFKAYSNVLSKLELNGKTTSEKAYIFINNSTPSICPVCGKPTSYKNINQGYKKYCSAKCQTNDPMFKAKMGDYYLNKYGCNNPMQNNKIKEKNIASKNARTKDQIKVSKEKSKRTNMKRYGVEYISQNKDVKERIEKTNLSRYGVKHCWNLPNEQRQNTIIKNMILKANSNEKITPLFGIDEYDGYLKEYSWKCTGCGCVFSKTYRFGIPECPNCSTKSVSIYQETIKEFLTTNNIEFVENCRKIISPLEIDFYLPKHNIGIEFDGLYWHSEKYKGKKYHLNKTIKCEEKGIRLIHIFEDELLYKKEIVFSRLSHILGKDCTYIGARKCIIKEIDSKEKSIFLNKYHIQGNDKSSIRIGAFYENELIGVMTFCKPRVFYNMKKQENTWELSRYAIKSNLYISGIASKLLKYFERNYIWDIVFSYADRRWSNGGLYKNIGFEFSNYTPPNYYYIIKQKRIHRFNYRKDKLKQFDNYDENKSESQIMKENSIYRIYDCGNFKFVKRNQKCQTP